MGYQQLPITPYNPPQQDTLGQYEKVLTLKSLLQGQQVQRQNLQQEQMKTQELQRDQTDQQAFRQAMMDPSMQGRTIGEVADVLAQHGSISMKAFQSAKKADLDHRKDIAGLDEKTLANRKAAHDATEQLYGNVMNMPDEQLAQNWPAVAQQYNSIPGNQNLPMNPQQPLTKQQLAQFGPLISMGNTYFEQEMARRTKQADLGIKQGEAGNMQQYGTTQKPQPVAGRDVPFPPNVEQQHVRMKGAEVRAAAQAKAAADAAANPPSPLAPPDPNSQSILAQTGLSLPAFYTLTGDASKLPRDKASRQRAFSEAEKWANSRGMDTSTMASQYKAYNETLSKNISRLNNTKIMEQELEGTIQNLQGVVKDQDLSRLKIANVVKIWAGGEVNDPLAQQYAMHLYQLRNELAAYGAATQGRSGNEITVGDQREAETTIRNGIASGGLAGLQTAVQNSTSKMGTVMQGSVKRSQDAIWSLFGVRKPGQQQQTQGGQQRPPLSSFERR